MERKKNKNLSARNMTGKVQNPRAKWMADAKWGLLAHFMGHVASDSSTLMPKEQWIKKVNSFNVKKFGDQLSALKAPYFFITIGQGGNYFCTPNKTFDKHFGKGTGARPERDLVADIIAELTPRGIRTCVYLPAYGSVKDQNKWLEVITEWSERWGKSISAWWLDGTEYPSYPEYMTYINAVKAGNKDVLVATKLASRLDAEQVHEDYTFGESGFLLEVSYLHYRDYRPGITDKMQLHYLTFLGEFWGIGEPRFPVKLVTGWTQHINNLGGTVSWDIPLTDTGAIPDKVYSQLEAISYQVNSGS
jgi:hypothetical protein